MEFNLSPSPQDESNYIDLCTILKGEKPFQLPKHFNGISSKKKLMTALKFCAMKSGFRLVHRSSKLINQIEKENKSVSAYLTLQCNHGLTYYGKEKPFDLVSKTEWSRKYNVKCKFRINISLHKHFNCWCIHNNKQSKSNTDHDHIGHFKMDASHIHTSLNLLPKDEITLAKQCSQLNMTNSNMASLINIRNVLGAHNNWTRHQIYYQNQMMEKLKNLNSTVSRAQKASSAEKLISMFEEWSDTNFLYLTYEPTKGLMLMTGKCPESVIINLDLMIDYRLVGDIIMN